MNSHSLDMVCSQNINSFKYRAGIQQWRTKKRIEDTWSGWWISRKIPPPKRDTTATKRKNRKNRTGNPPFDRKKLKEANPEWKIVLETILDAEMFPGFQKSPMFLLAADGDALPKFVPGIQQLRNYMADLNEQIVIFHSYSQYPIWCKIQ